jgi:hypothetical protein
MKVEQKGHTKIIKDTQENVLGFLVKLENEYAASFQSHNLIIDLSKYKSLALEDLEKFESLSLIHKQQKKSFVIVAPEVNFNEVSDTLIVVPTLFEAQDMIEMDEIERDLGF